MLKKAISIKALSKKALSIKPIPVKAVSVLLIPVLMIEMLMFAQLASIPVYAATGPGYKIGEIRTKNKVEDYTSFGALCDVASCYRDETITIEMTNNWDWGETEVGEKWSDYRLVIPPNCHATLNMNGYMFNRWRSWYNDWGLNGECILVEEGATLVINGGDSDEAKSRKHQVGVYTSKDPGNKATTYKEISGGVIAGGCSTNGAGGIHVESKATVILNDVTIAGCRAEVPWYDSAATRSGYGGGMWIKGSDTTVLMNHSTITGNHAQEDGGGIFESNVNNVRIEMNDSHVDGNYSRSDGGGIDLDGEKLVLKGTGASTVSGNETNGLGGGLYIYNDDVSVSGLTVNNNKAGKGGGIYTTEETVSLSELSIIGNTASDLGGGIYVANDKNIINSCEIKNNGKYGVYVEKNVDSGFKISGTTVITNNADGNLTLQNGTALVEFALSRGAEIGLGYRTVPEGGYYTVSPKRTGDCRQYLSSDHSGFSITYSYSDNGSNDSRKIHYVEKGHENDTTGYPAEKAETVDISIADAAPHVVGRVIAGGEKADESASTHDTYDLIRGIYHRQKTGNGRIDNDTVFYYTDALFDANPFAYNTHLATASWNFAFAGTYLREGYKSPESYKYKHAGVRQFLADIGCPDQNIYVNDFYVTRPGTDTIGVIIGSKELARSDGSRTGDILVPVTIRGGGYDGEWASNVKLGGGMDRDGEAQGFSEAADQTMEAIEYYIAKYGLRDELAAGKVKFWLAGFSRAGATANITSKRLIEKYADGTEGKQNKVFAYTCEAAKGGTDKAEKLSDKTQYQCIHNMIFASDLVPLVGPEEMGFKRYGVDHYIPGTAAGEIRKTELPAQRSGNSDVKNVTTYVDNYMLESKPTAADDVTARDYPARRARMIRHLGSIDSENSFNDFFDAMGVRFTPPAYGQVGLYEKASLENYMPDFLAFAQKSVIFSRREWADDPLKLGGREYSTVQQAVRESVALIFSLTDEEKASTMERLTSIIDKISFVSVSNINAFDLYDDVIGDWHTLSDTDKMKYINYFWDLIRDSGALDFMPESEAAKLQKNWPTLADFAFRLIDADWDTYPLNEGYEFPTGRPWAKADGSDGYFMMYMYTFATYMKQMLANHNPETNIAWARTYDSYYDEQGNAYDSNFNILKEYRVNWGNRLSESTGETYSIAAPKAFVKSEAETVSATGGSDENGGGSANNTAAGSGNETGAGGTDSSAVYTELTADEQGVCSLSGDQNILLDVGEPGNGTASGNNVTGEAIYYDLEDLSEGDGDNARVLAKEQIYRGGIALTGPADGSESAKTYRITAYARSYGVNSDKAIFTIRLTGKESGDEQGGDDPAPTPETHRVVRIKSLSDITGLAYASGREQIFNKLPKSTQVLLDDGRELELEIEWTLDGITKQESSEQYDAATWIAKAYVKLPVNVIYAPEIYGSDEDQPVQPLVTVKAITDEAPAASAPRASLASGEYVSDQVITLISTATGGTIRYTIDGSDPGTSDTARDYNGEEILFTRRDNPKGLTVRAIIKGTNSMRGSIESVYEYRFKDESQDKDDSSDDAVPSGDGGAGGNAEGDNFSAEDVIRMINELPSPTAESEAEQVEAAREAYGQLTDSEKNKISAEILAKLEKAEREIAKAADERTLNEAKQAAMTELESIRLSAYREPEKSRVRTAIAKARAAIETSRDPNAVNAALSTLRTAVGRQALYKSSLPKLRAVKPGRGSKSITVKWKRLSKKKQRRISGIEVCIAADRKFTRSRITRTVRKSAASKKITGLRSKKTYYVRTRTYLKRNGVKYAGKWSRVKKVKSR